MIVNKTHSLFDTMRLPKTEAPLPLSSLVTFAARYVSCPGHGLELNPRLNSKLNLTLNQHDTYLGPGHGFQLNPKLNSELNHTLNQLDTYLGPGHGLKTTD